MSAMQKVLRWGRDDLALSAAATLLRDAPDKLWRRIGCIAYENIGVASSSSAANSGTRSRKCFCFRSEISGRRQHFWKCRSAVL
jgi:replication-associated recombination protein RarA